MALLPTSVSNWDRKYWWGKSKQQGPEGQVPICFETMDTSHHCGGDPGVFLKNASDVNRRYLHRMEQATEGIFYCTAHLHNPDLELEDLGRYGSNHETWHRIWVRSSKALMREMQQLHGRHRQLEMEGLAK